MRQHANPGQAANHRKPAHPERQQHAHQGGEDDQQQRNDDDQRDHLGALQVGGQVLVEVGTDRDVPRAEHLEPVRADLGAQLRVVLSCSGVIVLEGDLGEGMVAVGRGHGAGLFGRQIKGGLDGLDARIRFQRLQRGQHGLLEGGVADGHRVAAEDEHE